MECMGFGQKHIPRESLLRVVPWLLAFCGGAAASQCTFGLAQLQAPACEVLKTANAGNLVIPAAIPLPGRVVPTQVVSAKPTVRKADSCGKVAGMLDSANKQNEVHGFFQFAHPQYMWMNGAQPFSGVADELDDPAPEAWWQSDHELILSIGWGNSVEVLQHTESEDKRRLMELDASVGSEGEWVKYMGSICLGITLFLLLACGLCARGSRYHEDAFTIHTAAQTAVSLADDGHEEDGVDSSPFVRFARALLGLGDQSHSYSDGLSDIQIQKLPLAPYCADKIGGPSSPLRCSICLGNVKPGDMLRRIHTCNHQFHSSCVDAWLARSATCPLCRQEIVTDELTADAACDLVDDECLQPMSPSVNSHCGSYVEPLIDGPMEIPDGAQNQELPYSYPARSIETTSWSETGESLCEEWELVERET